jgi:hypothetical protein
MYYKTSHMPKLSFFDSFWGVERIEFTNCSPVSRLTFSALSLNFVLGLIKVSRLCCSLIGVLVRLDGDAWVIIVWTRLCFAYLSDPDRISNPRANSVVSNIESSSESCNSSASCKSRNCSKSGFFKMDLFSKKMMPCVQLLCISHEIGVNFIILDFVAM